MASSGEEFEEEIEEPLPSSPRRKTRGINTKLKEDVRREVEFNEFSLPVGKSFPTFSSQVGVITRNHINIKYKSWKIVPQEDKDRLWHEIRRDYNLPDDPAKKKKIMQQCSLSFKRFKTRLRNEFMKVGKNPCPLYEFIEESDWKAFLAMEDTDERKLEREKGQNNALKKKIQTHLGRMGYRGREEAWAEEAAKGGLVGEIHKLYDPRARRFLLARVVKDKDKKGGYLPIPLSEYYDRLVQLEGQLEAGNLSLPTGKDLLWYVIGPEHGGRTRGVGCTVGIREGIHDYKETRNRMTKDQIRDETIASLTERVQNVEGVVAVISKSQTNMPEGASDSAMMRSCGSPMFGSNDTQERKKCYLLVPHVINREVICARGVLCIGPGSEMLHGSPILDGYSKVQLDHVEQGYGFLDLPVPSDEHSKLEDAIGSFIQWPKLRISIFKPSSRPSPTPDQRDVRPSSSKHSTSRLSANRTCGDASPSSGPSSTYHRQNQELELDRYSTRIMSRPSFIQDYYLRWMSRSSPGLSVLHDIPSETFSSLAPLSINVTPMEVMALLTNQELDMTILALFVSALHNSVDTHLEPNRCAFLNPFVINALMCQKKPTEVGNHLREMLSQPNIDNYLLTYHQGCHWSLFILRPNELTGYILDSICKEKTKDNYWLSSVVEKFFPGFRWNFPEVQQQESNWECGYYVMRWIYDFVKFQQYAFPAFIPWNDTRPYDHSHLNAMVRFWTSAISIPND